MSPQDLEAAGMAFHRRDIKGEDPRVAENFFSGNSLFDSYFSPGTAGEEAWSARIFDLGEQDVIHGVQPQLVTESVQAGRKGFRVAERISRICLFQGCGLAGASR